MSEGSTRVERDAQPEGERAGASVSSASASGSTSAATGPGAAAPSGAEGADAAPTDAAAGAAQDAPGGEGAEAKPKSPWRSDLALRLASSAVLIPFVLWTIAQGGLFYLGVVIAIGLLAQYEFYGLIIDKGARPITSVGLGFGAAVIVVAYFGSSYQAMLLMTASLLVLMVAQLGKNEIQEAMASISGTFFGVFYVSWLLSHAVLLRKFDEVAASHHDPALLVTLNVAPDVGIFLMVYTLVSVVGCDVGAYFAGRFWGRTKLAPQISPNKSVEGALGGVIFGGLIGLGTKLVFDVFWPDWSAVLPWSAALGFAFVLCVVGIIGDLVESLLKRDAKVKDTGALLPGMGGVLDRVDAPLLGLPVMYYLMLGYLYFRSV